LNVGLVAAASSISCSMPGDCGAGGVYADGSTTAQAFVANETNGKWGDAIEVPGSSSINIGGAVLYSISCPSNGECGGAGQYADALGNGQAFVANEVNGAWGNVMEIPGSSSLFSEGIGTNPLAISCGTPTIAVLVVSILTVRAIARPSSSTKPQGSGATPLKFPARAH